LQTARNETGIMDDGQEHAMGQGGNASGLEVTIRAGGVTVAVVRLPLAARAIEYTAAGAEGPKAGELVLAEGLRPLTQAERIGELLAAGESVESIAIANGLKASSVARKVLLLRLSPELRKLMRGGLLSERRAMVLGRLDELGQHYAARWGAGVGPKGELLSGPGEHVRPLKELRRAVNAVLAGDVTARGLWDWTPGIAGDDGGEQLPDGLYGPMFRRVGADVPMDTPRPGTAVEAVG